MLIFEWVCLKEDILDAVIPHRVYYEVFKVIEAGSSGLHELRGITSENKVEHCVFHII